MSNASDESNILDEIYKAAANRWQETEQDEELEFLENALGEALRRAFIDLEQRKAIEDTLYSTPVVHKCSALEPQSKPQEEECDDILISAIASGLNRLIGAVLLGLGALCQGVLWIKAKCDETWRSR